MARPVGLLRTFIVPLGACSWWLLTKTTVISPYERDRISATVLGVFVLIMVLSGVSATVFESAPAGSWRRRMPSIFLDVARFAIIAVGVAMIFAYVWGANVGGLFTALGISSIVLGLTLQNSVGQIISGLLLLFEQPFQMGDWRWRPPARGRVHRGERRGHPHQHRQRPADHRTRCWRVKAFANLSRRPPGGHFHHRQRQVRRRRRPRRGVQVLDRRRQLLHLIPVGKPIANAATSTDYTVTIPVRSPADDIAARSTFQRWLWCAARRAGLHLDGIADDYSTVSRRADALRKIAPILRANSSDLEGLLPQVKVTRFGDGEVMQKVGEIPGALVVHRQGRGAARRVRQRRNRRPHHHPAPRGFHRADGSHAREPVKCERCAIGEVTVLQIERDVVEHLVFRKPELLQDLSQAIDERRDQRMPAGPCPAPCWATGTAA